MENDLAAMPASRREVELLIDSDDVDATKKAAIDLCAKAFGADPGGRAWSPLSAGEPTTTPTACCPAFGLTGEIARVPGDDGFDIVYVTLR